MQIVINISKRTYDYILKKHNIVNGDRLEVTDAICDGTLLEDYCESCIYKPTESEDD